MTVEQWCECGGRGAHTRYCDVGVDIVKVSHSMKRDPERWDESYRERNTENVRSLALATTNGHSVRASRYQEVRFEH